MAMLNNQRVIRNALSLGVPHYLDHHKNPIRGTCPEKIPCGNIISYMEISKRYLGPSWTLGPPDLKIKHLALMDTMEPDHPQRYLQACSSPLYWGPQPP